MIYLDNGATSFHKPPAVLRAVQEALRTCANPGRGSHRPAMAAAERIYDCREAASRLFGCLPEQVVLTTSGTHGLNMAIRTLVRPGDPVVISGFEHNAVTRPLHALGAQVTVAGRKLFSPEDTLEQMEDALRKRPKALICTHVSNVFGYILPVEQIGWLCRHYGVPWILDAAQSAGSLPLAQADFVAMPGHKGLLGPQGTGLLLCTRPPEPLLYGGTGSASLPPTMPEDLPDRGEAGTLNVPGYAGLTEGLRYLHRTGIHGMARRQQQEVRRAAAGLERLGFTVFSGPCQLGTLSFLPHGDCEEAATKLARKGIALRAGLHCAPLAHESAGTLDTGTLRISYGHDACPSQTQALLTAARVLL
ncbi:MAG: aminotransferase class V-fold PLP-dependent enzyme [Oscillospiraceae bacterium]|nr:aminotransferase class V-fold PLP-dependent enzyme [Oscillospiraceae bacterium]